jgi:SAM-dependent methyltransferase
MQMMEAALIESAVRALDVPGAKPAGYCFAAGPRGVFRTYLFHSIYAAFSRRRLRAAGLDKTMRVADFGCGPAASTRMLAALAGHVTAIDSSAAQLEQAAGFCLNAGVENVSVRKAGANATGYPARMFDLVYCRDLLSHVSDPEAAVAEMRRVLKPGGALLVEEFDYGSAASDPRAAVDAFAQFLPLLARSRGADFRLAPRLAGLLGGCEAESYQPVLPPGEKRLALKWSVEEAAGDLVAEGLMTNDRLEHAIGEMEGAVSDAGLLVFAPRMVSAIVRTAD